MIDLRLGDCTEILATLPSHSVDCVITDPPYPCIKRSYGTWTEADWFKMMRVVVPECMRILKPTGSAVFILQPNSERVGRMRTWLWEFMLWVGKEWGVVQDVWWWNVTAFTTGLSTPRERGLLRESMKACVWIGGHQCYRNQSAILIDESLRNAQRRITERTNRRLTYPSGQGNNPCQHLNTAVERGGVTPFNVLPIPNADSTSSAGSHGHGAGTPAALCSWWLRYICPPSGAVLDPFSGSGTVSLAALKQGKDAIGIERMPEYHAIAEKRVSEALDATPLYAGAAP